MSYNVSLTRISRNVKTGSIPVSTTGQETCPMSCAMREGCYAKHGPLRIHWDKVSSGEHGVDWDTFCEQIRRLPHGQLWRHNQAGDLPGDGLRINGPALWKLVRANVGRKGFTYTHYPLSEYNKACIEAANADGFTINVSCDSLELCDVIAQFTTAPLSVVLHSHEDRHVLYTPAGNKVIVCPATYRDDVNCANCGVCQVSTGRAIIGFPAHGTKKRVIDVQLIGAAK